MKNYLKNKRERKQMQRGITLVALVITIVILIILATIAINMIFGENGLINRADEAKLEQSKAEAKQKLELVLADAYVEKNINKEEYNQYEFLDQFVKNKTNNRGELKGDTAIYNGYAFELDRNVPELKDYVGIQEELKFPELNVTFQNSDDKQTLNVTIKAKEEQNGINKIEILEDGFVIHTFEYENIKSEIIENYELKRNGNYIVKVYSKLTDVAYVNVEGLTMSVEFSKNGDTTWKTEHSTTLNVSEKIEKVKSIKYQWTQSTVEPEEDTFIDICNNGDTLTKAGVTGKWYLWILLETEIGNKRIDRSEAFYFDNLGPIANINLGIITRNSIELIVDASDDDSGLVTNETYKYYLDDTLKKSTTENKYTYSGLQMGKNYEIKVEIVDNIGNKTTKTTTKNIMITDILKEGDYVNYIDKNGTTRSCRVLYNNSSYGLQIITSGSVKNISIGSSTFSTSKTSYNNAVSTLNNAANAYNNSEYSTRARCVGSHPTSTSDTITYFTSSYSYMSAYNGQFKDGDENYKIDSDKMSVLGIRKIDVTYWFASRDLRSYDSASYFDIRYVLPNGGSHSIVCCVFSDGSTKSGSSSYGLRPVFILKPTIKVTGGNGTSSSPYTLGV